MEMYSSLIGKNILLRTLEAKDATEHYLAWLNDPKINAYLEVRFSPPNKVEDLAEFIKKINNSRDSLLLGIFLRAGNRHIGNIKLGPIDLNHAVSDLGFLIGDDQQWGKGYASEAILLLTEYAFDQLGLAKLTAGCSFKNQGSFRALQKVGFKKEGHLISHWKFGSIRQDGLLMGRINPTYDSENHC